MKNVKSRSRLFMLLALAVSIVSTSTRLQAQSGCSPNLGLPFTDLGSMSSVFCQSVAEAYYSGLTNGTTPTTFSPDDNVPRSQMAAFVTRTLDQSLRRGSRRAALNQWWTPGSVAALNLSSMPTGDEPRMAACDGTDIWVASKTGEHLIRVRASDGMRLGTFTVPDYVYGVLTAMGRVFLTREICNGADLIMIDPRTGADSTVATNLGNGSKGIALDGSKIWTANDGRIGESPCVFGGSVGSISIVTPGETTPWSVTTQTTGFTRPYGILYDGSNIWVTDRGENRLKKVNKTTGAVLQNIQVGNAPGHPVFDGMNIWVPNSGTDDIYVVRVKDAAGNPLASPFVLKVVTAPFMLAPHSAAFDGERVLVACQSQGIFLFKAADLSFITGITTGPDTTPFGACSDGLNFFVTMNSENQLLRF
ncbi:MAG: S-layer homology domain-containing protein [Acidobacteriota bacterium]